MSESRKVVEWTAHPFTSYGKRNLPVHHRVRVEWYPSAGCDVVHEVVCPGKTHLDEWTAVEVWEFRDHGVEKQTYGPEWGVM